MTRATRNVESTGKAHQQQLYVAFELGISEWTLGFTTDLGTPPRVRVMSARDLERLAREIAEAKTWFRVKAPAAVRSCDEAGRDGVWLHRCLTSAGIDNRVVDSSSIEVNRRLRRAKFDGLDARTRLGMLVRSHTGEPKVWSVVRVPTVGGGGPAAPASGAADAEGGADAGDEPGEGAAGEPGDPAHARTDGPSGSVSRASGCGMGRRCRPGWWEALGVPPGRTTTAAREKGRLPHGHAGVAAERTQDEGSGRQWPARIEGRSRPPGPNA
jgi:hypothetical protein